MTTANNLEQVVIGALLAEPDAFPRIADQLQAEDFTRADCARAFGAIHRMVTEGNRVDLWGVEAAGGGSVADLGRMQLGSPGAANIEHYAGLVRTAARRRQIERDLMAALTRIRGAGESPGADQRLLVEEVTQRTINALESPREATSKPFHALVRDALDEASQVHQKRASGGVTGVSTTLPWLNQLTGGFHGPKLIVLGGRPGTFKTAYATQVATRAALDGIPVGFVSLEMGASELVARVIANRLKVDGSDLARGEPSALHAAQSAQDWDWPLHIEDQVLSWPEIAARIMTWRHRHGIELAVVDYLQIIRIPGKGSRFEKLSEVSREAKLLAKRLGIPILLLAQISRDVERENRRPYLSDIRECGNVEQDADIVLFTHAHRVQDRPPEYELILAKQRNGPAREVVRLQIDAAHYRIGEQWEQ